MIPKGPYMDMHTHILPGLDDGSRSMNQTANMLKIAYDEGIRVIVATPHYGIRNPDFNLKKAEEVLQNVQHMADEITPGIKLVMGNELYYSDGVLDALDRGEASTIGGTSYALIEFSTSDSRDRIDKCIRELTWKGYRPIIAHLERYRCLEDDVDAVRDLVDRGCVVQINCRSFLDESALDNKGGDFFLERKGDWVRMLLSEGLVHLIASDCHDDRMRSPIYASALEAMEPYCSSETLRDISKNNIVKLIRNERIV